MVFFKESEKRLLNIKTDEIIQNANQPRKSFDEYELYKLSESIRHNGIIQPLTVRKTDNGYILIAGERRLRAAKKAGLKKVPCIVYRVSGETAAAYSVIENLQRADLNVFEQAEGINRLITEFGISHADAAERLGIAQSTLSNKLRVLRLSEAERSRITAARLTERHARALLRLDDLKLRMRALNIIADKHLTVAESERMITRMLGRKRNNRSIPLNSIRDVRLFVNTLNHAVDTIRRAGIEADSVKSETEEYIEYVVRIPKQPGTTPVLKTKTQAVSI